MNTDNDVRELLERMAARAGHRSGRPGADRSARPPPARQDGVVGSPARAGGCRRDRRCERLALEPVHPSHAEPHGGPISPRSLRDGEVMIQDHGSGRLEALDPEHRRSTHDRSTARIRCGLHLPLHAISGRRSLARLPPVACGGFIVRTRRPGIWVTNALGDQHRLTAAGSCRTWPVGLVAAGLHARGLRWRRRRRDLVTIDPRTGDPTSVANPSCASTRWPGHPTATELVYTAHAVTQRKHRLCGVRAPVGGSSRAARSPCWLRYRRSASPGRPMGRGSRSTTTSVSGTGSSS